MDKFDHLIAARSGFKGNDLVEFNKGTSKAQAKGASSGLETASYLIPIPLAAAHKATRVAFVAAKQWKILRSADRIGDAAAALSKLDNPIKHKVVSVIGKTLGKLGKLQEKMGKAGHDIFKHTMRPSTLGPIDKRRRVTQMVSEMATPFLTAPKPFAMLRPGTKGGEFLRNVSEFHNRARGVGSVGQLFANILGKPTDGYKRTRAALGKLDALYSGASKRGGLNLGTSAPVLFARYQLMREHVSNNTAIGEMHKRGTQTRSLHTTPSGASWTPPPWYDKYIPNPGWGWKEKNAAK